MRFKRKPARRSHNAFKRRARQTARVNTLTPLRGGIRL